MAKQRPDHPYPIDPEHANYEVGDAVIILRPHLWSQCSATVEKVIGGSHLLKIAGHNGETFHAYALAKELNLDL